MAYRRRTTRRPRRRIARRRTTVRRRRTAPHRTLVLNLVRTVSSFLFTQAATAVTLGDSLNLSNGGLMTLGMSNIPGEKYFSLGLSFCGDDFPDFTRAAEMWEEYRITSVTVKCMALPTAALSQAPGVAESALGGWCYSVIDTDDAAAFPASSVGMALMRERDSYKIKNLFTNWKRTIRVKQVAPVYAGITTAYQSQKPQWVSTAYSDANHYGIKVLWHVVNPSATGVNLNFQFTAQYHVSFRGAK